MKSRTAKIGSIAMACSAFLGVLFYATESQAYWFSTEEAYSDATSKTAGPLGASCYPSDGGMCTVGDHVTYTVSALNIHIPTITVTPSNYQSWAVSSSDWAWCYVSITCHLGGGATETLTDQHVWQPAMGGSPSSCYVNCSSNSADDMYVNVGVGIYPP